MKKIISDIHNAQAQFQEGRSTLKNKQIYS